MTFPAASASEDRWVPPQVDQAMDALEQAALSAEKGQPMGASLRAEERDFVEAVRLHPKTVRSHLDRLMLGENPELGLDTMLDSGALEAIFPEIHAMVGFGDGEWRHKDVWKHTKQVVFQAPATLEVRWSALFHDIGKLKTRSISPEGKVHFLGHAEVGTRMFERLDRRVHLFSSSEDASLKSTIRFLIWHHLRANQYETSWTDSAVRRFARELGVHLEDLFCLSRADITTKRPEKKRRGLSNLDELEERIKWLAEQDAVRPPLPTGVGNAIMHAFALPPSRLVGEIKRALEGAIAAEELEPYLPVEAYVAYVAEHRARWGM